MINNTTVHLRSGGESLAGNKSSKSVERVNLVGEQYDSQDDDEDDDDFQEIPRPQRATTVVQQRQRAQKRRHAVISEGKNASNVAVAGLDDDEDDSDGTTPLFIMNNCMLYHPPRMICCSDDRGAMTKKAAMLKARTRESRTLSAQAAAWLARSKTVTSTSTKFGLTKIRTSWGISPTEDMAARRKDEHHVVVIAESLNIHGVQQHNVIILIFTQDIINHPKLSLDNLDFTPFLDDEKAPVPMYTIAGDHTCGAMQMLHEAKPQNPKWLYMYVTIAVTDDTPENRRLAQIAGDLDNKVGNIKQEMTTFDYIEQIHRTYMNLIKKFGDPSVPANLKNINKDLARYKADCTITMGDRNRIATATLGTFFQIAKRTGKVWTLIERIFTEHRQALYASSRGRTLTPKDHLGHSYFTDMANIPDAMLIKWLQSVVDQKMTVSQFKAKCSKYKKILVLQKAILVWYAAEYHQDFDNYDELVEVHPFLATSEFVSQVIGVFNPTKKDPKIPMSIVKIIVQKIEQTNVSRNRVRSVSTTIKFQPFSLFIKNNSQLFFINCLHTPSEIHQTETTNNTALISTNIVYTNRQ